MKFDEVLIKYTNSKSAADTLIAKIPRRNSLYNGDGKIINKRTKKEVQAECHQNMVYELIEAQVSNQIPEPVVTPMLAEDSQRAIALSNYLSYIMRYQKGIAVNDRAERGTLKNGYHFYLIEWDNSRTSNSGYGYVKISDYAAGSVYLQPGITNFDDSEYIFLISTATCSSVKRLYGVDIPPDVEGQDVANIVTCYYLNEEGDLGRTIFAKNSQVLISEDNYFELRRVAVCKECGEPILDLDNPCPLCGSKNVKWKILDEETATEDIYVGDVDKNAQMRAQLRANGQPDDPYVGYEKIISKGDKIPFYHIRELPVVMRLNVSSDEDIYGKSDIDLVEQNQDTLNRLTTKEEENILKAGSFVTYPEGTKIPADDSTLKLVPISDPRLIDSFSVQTIQANMQQDDILATRMYQYGRSTLGVTESFQGKKDTTATSGKAKQLAAAQSAGRLESKQRMKVFAYSEIYRKVFKFLLAYADETQYYIKQDVNGDVLQLTFNRYMFLKRNDKTRQIYWDDNFIIEADNATLISNKTEMWETITQQFLSGTLGNVADPVVIKLYWSMMKQLQFPFAASVYNSIIERNADLDPAMKEFLLQHPDILQYVAQLMAQAKAGQSNQTGQSGQAGVANGSNIELKTGQAGMTAPEAANPMSPQMRTSMEQDNESTE